MALLALLLCAPAARAEQSWRMLDQYPAHYVSKKLAPTEKITVDGRLDEDAWLSVESTVDMVDITRHEDQQLNAIPNDLQARVKVRWDDDYFYVGAVLHESYVTAENVGHSECRALRFLLSTSDDICCRPCRRPRAVLAGQRLRDLHRRQRHDAVLHGVRDVRAECDVRHQVGKARRHIARVRQQRRVLARAPDLRQHQLPRLRRQLDHGDEAAPGPHGRPAQQHDQGRADERDAHARRSRHNGVGNRGGGHRDDQRDGVGELRALHLPLLPVVGGDPLPDPADPGLLDAGRRLPNLARGADRL